MFDNNGKVKKRKKLSKSDCDKIDEKLIDTKMQIFKIFRDIKKAKSESDKLVKDTLDEIEKIKNNLCSTECHKKDKESIDIATKLNKIFQDINIEKNKSNKLVRDILDKIKQIKN